MSFVIPTRSYRSRNSLQSISTSVVLPDPTGPPMPIRNGGFRLVRLRLLMVLLVYERNRREYWFAWRAEIIPRWGAKVEIWSGLLSIAWETTSGISVWAAKRIFCPAI